MPTNYNETTIAWKSKGLLDESIKLLATQHKSVAPKLKWIYNSRNAVEFKGSFSKQKEATFTLRKVVFCLLPIN